MQKVSLCKIWYDEAEVDEVRLWLRKNDRKKETLYNLGNNNTPVHKIDNFPQNKQFNISIFCSIKLTSMHKT